MNFASAEGCASGDKDSVEFLFRMLCRALISGGTVNAKDA